MLDEPLKTSVWEARVFLGVAETIVGKVLSHGTVSCSQSYILRHLVTEPIRITMKLHKIPIPYTQKILNIHPDNCFSGLRWLKMCKFTLL